MKKTTAILFLCLVGLMFAGRAPAALNAGDIAILAFNLNPDDYRCVAMTDIPKGEVVRFTDNGWSNTIFRTGEGVFVWTNPAMIAAGTIFSNSLGGMSLANTGDQILMYQVAPGSTTFIYAVNCWGTDGVWQAAATNSSSSGLPTGLTNGECAVALPTTSSGNWVFNTNIFASGTRTEWLTAIGQRTNWLPSTTMPVGFIFVTDGSTRPVDPQSFTATAVSTSEIDLVWTKNASNDDVMVAFVTNNLFAFGDPTGTYAVGNLITGGGEVLFNGSGTAYSHTNLAAGRTYFYKAWSVAQSTNYSVGVATSAATPDPNFPLIVITNPVPPAVRYLNTTASADLSGTMNALVGELAWTNTLTGLVGTAPAANPWTITGIGLNVGANIIKVGGTNNASQSTAATITVVRASAVVFNPGDLQIIGFRGDANDGMALLTWVSLPEGQPINLTDCGWSNTQLRASEDFATWYVPAGGLPAGTVAVFEFTNSIPNGVVDAGSVTGNLNGISSSGDQLFLFTGPQNAPSFVYGLDFNGANTNWDAFATTANNSGLPPELNVTGGNMAIRQISNSQYTGIRTGTLADLKAAVLSTNNWTGSTNGVGFVLDSTDFVITGGGDVDGIPGSWWDQYSIPTLERIATNNPDGDTANNLEEYLADTDPTNSDSCLGFTAFSYISPAVLAHFKGGTQAVQIIEFTSDLTSGNWLFFASNQPPTSVTNTFGVAPSAPGEFYRIRAHR